MYSRSTSSSMRGRSPLKQQIIRKMPKRANTPKHPTRQKQITSKWPFELLEKSQERDDMAARGDWPGDVQSDSMKNDKKNGEFAHKFPKNYSKRVTSGALSQCGFEMESIQLTHQLVHCTTQDYQPSEVLGRSSEWIQPARVG